MNKSYSCLIIDDEPKEIALLSLILNEQYRHIYVKTTCTEWTEALAALQTNVHDLIFIDISMPGKNGIDLLKLVHELNSEIIFITAYGEYAIEAFKFSAVGYILKPIDEAELFQAIERAISRIDNRRIANSKTNKNALIGIPEKRGIDYVKAESIISLEAVNKCTKVTTETSVVYSSYNIGKFKDLLDSSNFFQVHRSFIVNMSHVRRYLTTSVIVMSNGSEIPISRNFREEFLKSINTISGTR